MEKTLNLFKVLENIKSLTLKIGELQKENLGLGNLKIARKSTGIDLVTDIDKKIRTGNN